jgi:hypothetical protein
MRLRMPRYSLATMLLAVTAIALLLWGVPAGRELLRRKAIERALCQLSAGLEPDLFAAMPLDSHRDLLRRALFYDRGSAHQLVDRTPQGQYLTDFYEIIAGRETRGSPHPV